ncbi:hypothetical protein [Rhizohabitans arisaemae]|uniref:hypothetical protein n=1 Tax=Rhizohabitans arisaemae TaxID=2720610 RepID=UPI0024B11BA4|nr:hypothetical protein [Rhizohabitans arisaemae]
MLTALPRDLPERTIDPHDRPAKSDPALDVGAGGRAGLMRLLAGDVRIFAVGSWAGTWQRILAGLRAQADAAGLIT